MSINRPNRRWTDERVVEMRDMYREGMSLQALADREGCSAETVRLMVIGTTYANVAGFMSRSERAARAKRLGHQGPRAISGRWGWYR